jgi:hypothetical protein
MLTKSHLTGDIRWGWRIAMVAKNEIVMVTEDFGEYRVDDVVIVCWGVPTQSIFGRIESLGTGHMFIDHSTLQKSQITKMEYSRITKIEKATGVVEV